MRNGKNDRIFTLLGQNLLKSCPVTLILQLGTPVLQLGTPGATIRK